MKPKVFSQPVALKTRSRKYKKKKLKNKKCYYLSYVRSLDNYLQKPKFRNLGETRF